MNLKKELQDILGVILVLFILINIMIFIMGTIGRSVFGFNKPCSFKKYNIIIPLDYVSCRIIPHVYDFSNWLKEEV